MQINRFGMIGLAVSASFLCTGLFAQGQPKVSAAAQRYLDEAKGLSQIGGYAAAMHRGVCSLAVRQQDPNSGIDTKDRSAIEPTQVFDNLYNVGDRDVGMWLINTSIGIIMIDANNSDDNARQVLLPQMQKLGLDPAQTKVIIVTHGHGDHYGAAEFFRKMSGAPIYMSKADWEMPVAPRTKTPYWSPKPKPDVIATDGQKITVGDATVTLYLTPGHTPGTVSVILPVKDHGVTRMAALWGGTGADSSNPNALKLYSGSLKHFTAVTKAANVEIELLAHPGLDDTIKREDAVRALKPGQQNPFLIGSENYQKYLTMMQDCIQARLANLEGQRTP